MKEYFLLFRGLFFKLLCWFLNILGISLLTQFALVLYILLPFPTASVASDSLYNQRFLIHPSLKSQTQCPPEESLGTVVS